MNRRVSARTGRAGIGKASREEVQALLRPEPVRLTRRQLEVLRALDTPATLAQIAEQQEVGLETIRSTVRATYRRLGVHSREEALDRGRALRLI